MRDRGIEAFRGAEAVLTLRAFALVLLPACIAVLGSSGSIVTAVNPRVLIGTIRRLGWDYVLIWLVLIALAFAAHFTSTRLADAFLGLPLAIVGLMYGWLAVFSVIGGALYERRHELGIDTWRSPERDRARHEADQSKDHARFIDELIRTLARRSTQGSVASRAKSAGRARSSPDEYSWLCEALLRWPDRRLASRIAQDYLTLLLAAKRYSEALRQRIATSGPIPSSDRLPRRK